MPEKNPNIAESESISEKLQAMLNEKQGRPSETLGETLNHKAHSEPVSNQPTIQALCAGIDHQLRLTVKQLNAVLITMGDDPLSATERLAATIRELHHMQGSMSLLETHLAKRSVGLDELTDKLSKVASDLRVL